MIQILLLCDLCAFALLRLCVFALETKRSALWHEKITGLNQTRTENIMEAENINAIGNQLADLSTRVNELRGYL
ncbi:MAG: hypothetical protein WBK51_14605 [Polaromonas sp.]